jgi:uncharacterized membrane protein
MAVGAAVVLSVTILLVFGAIRMVDMAGPPSPRPAFEARYLEHPQVALLHMVPGLLFMTLAPLQFVRRIRQRHLALHRRLGWVLAGCAAASGGFGLVANFRLPAFGGLPTQAATVFFGPIFLFSLANAIRHIRRRRIDRHREWMIRTFALAMGVASIRVFVGLFQVLGGLRIEECFGTSFWLGFSVNLLVAEIWINRTRARPASVAVPSVSLRPGA